MGRGGGQGKRHNLLLVLIFSASRSFTNLKLLKKWHNRAYKRLQLYNKVLAKFVVKWFPCNKTIRLLPQDQGLILMSEELATLFSPFLIGTICIWHLCWKLKVPMAGRMRKRFSGQHRSKFDPPLPHIPSSTLSSSSDISN